MLDGDKNKQFSDIPPKDLLDIIHKYNLDKYKKYSKGTIGSFPSLLNKLKDYESVISVVEETIKIDLDYEPVSAYIKKQQLIDSGQEVNEQKDTQEFLQSIAHYSDKLLDKIIKNNNVDLILDKDRDLLLSVITNINLSRVTKLSHETGDSKKYIDFLIDHADVLTDKFLILFVEQLIKEVKEEDKLKDDVVEYISDSVLQNHNLKIDIPAVEKLTNIKADKLELHMTEGDFLSQKWHNYIDKLEAVLTGIKYRHDNEFELNDLMPPQKQILELQQECMDLTEEWYGAGNSNLSCFYLYFMRMCEIASITQYEYLKVGKRVSPDGYISLLDIDEKNQCIQENERQYRIPFAELGGKWAKGRSDIDASNLSNIFYYKHARQMQGHQLAKKMIVEIVRKMQLAILSRVSNVADVVVSEGCITFLPSLLLVKYGKLLENWGQMPPDLKELLWTLIQDKYPTSREKEDDNVFMKFADFSTTNPGDYFTDYQTTLDISSKQLHMFIKTAGIWSKKLVLISRTEIENLSPRRYMI